MKITSLRLRFGVFALIFLAVFTLPVLAHFVWIEVPSTLSVGQPHAVRLYFGEYHEFLREEAGGRLDERSHLKAWIVSPDGKKASVELDKDLNFFQTTVKPEKPGIYSLIASDVDSEVVDGTSYSSVGMVFKPMFYARTQFLAFEEGRVSERISEITELLDLDILPVTSHLDPSKGTISPKVGEEVVIQVVFRGNPLPKAKPNALAPNGWLKELRTNSKGMTRFTPLWPGTYVIDCVYLETNPGQFKGKEYAGVRYRATYTVQVVDNTK